MVRAKFKVTEITHFEDGLSTIKLSAVYEDNPDSENAKFWKFTPSGEIEMQVLNTDAVAEFKPGKEFYVDFTWVNAGHLVASE